MLSNKMDELERYEGSECSDDPTKKINDLFLTNTNVQKMNVKKNHPKGSISDPVPNFAFTQPSKKGKNNK